MNTATTLSACRKSSKKYFTCGLSVISFSLLMLTACKKNDDMDVNAGNQNRIPQIVADNFNLKMLHASIGRSNLKPLLSGDGPFTLLAPSDAAFKEAGYGTPLSIATASQSLIINTTAYHVLNGNYDLNRMPFLFNQEIRSQGGGKLYVTRWVKGNDTVITVNGSRVLAQGIKATNGQVQVINRLLEPYLHETVTDAVTAETSLTLFSQALQRSGLSTLLKGKGPYTVYAPSNEAMAKYGYQTMEDIEKADPEKLAVVLRYHIAADRRFVYDYILSTNATVTTQGMIDNNTVKVQLVPDAQAPGLYKSITLQGTGNTLVSNLVRQNIITGNGVLHIVDQVLKITQ
ncbi:fasciclin domain-containing protein [Chitinophaga nivalis]|uniref:Fasciclin domain-containing protein n=1 Tax=Chitinophaga nivalis TaxID=2991709 RepID=A0ABT3IGM2_9BACT|nr:fasciclin domain-containing protein [Chitinophaga nivalis]MCW3467211.1 fasciclin domain-containing protein [Chitinophaga nivalis]MCW3483097.1 fasciclin domain-containing protein [Chitinophaga nivalis]